MLFANCRIKENKGETAGARFVHLTVMVLYQTELENINKPGQLLVHHTEAALFHPISFAVLQSELDKLKNGSQTT